jgi:pimeloyl-ACP methyl ester carboxylesterase
MSEQLSLIYNHKGAKNMAINPVIFVHGIQGSWLKDEYPVDYNDAVVWTGILRRDFDSLHLHSLDATVDAQKARFIMPHQAIPLIYQNIVDEIRDEMDYQPYAYVFTYDWRKDNRLAAKALSEFIDRVLRVAGVHEKADGRSSPQRVVLIGHSMGGLVIKWCALKIADPEEIEKVITIATPFRGSLKAVEALLPGARNLFGMEHKKSMRYAARTLPGLYQLLPSWPGALVDSVTEEAMDPFNEASWQKNLVLNLAETYSPEFFQEKLEDARDFSNVISAPWPENLCSKIYYAYGKGSKTWWQVKVNLERDNFFMFKDALSDNDGDGTVHRLSSFQEEVEGDNRTHEDERHPVRDIFAGQHANMPNHSELQDWLLGVLKVNPHAEAAFESPY